MTPLSYPIDPCGDYSIGETEDYCLLTWGTASLSSDSDIEYRSDHQITDLIDLSTNELELASNISIYPNPASDLMKIVINDGLNVKSMHLSDLNGKLIKHWDKFEIENKMSLDLSALKSAVYILYFKTEGGQYIYKKIIVSK